MEDGVMTANTEGNTDVATLKGGSALQKDPWSRFGKFIKQYKRKKKFVKASSPKTVCVDFDGVIHSYTSGWNGIDSIPDPIVSGAIEFLWNLIKNGHQVIIFSSRAKGKGINAIKDYISLNEGLWRKEQYELGVGVPRGILARLLTYTNEKIPADVYIDDRAFQFRGAFPTLSEIENFKSWVDFAKSSLAIKLSDVETNPTPAQKESGNYKKAHVSLHGLDITIENPKGSYRKGVDKSGKEWKCKMHCHYGYFKRTEGKDGDHVDCFIGPNPDSEIIYIVNQVDSSGKFDEHKVMMGFATEKEAKEGYLSNYTKGWKGCGSIVSMTLPQFKTWLSSKTKTKQPARQIMKSSSELSDILDFDYYFEKGARAEIGEVREWNDGNKYRKEASGWVRVGEGDKKAYQVDDKQYKKITGENRSSHRASVEKAMDQGRKIPVKVLREYPSLLEKYPQYKKRVQAIDAISKSMKAGSKAGGVVEESVNSAKQGKIPVDTAISRLEDARRTLNFGEVKAGFPTKSYDKLWNLDSKIADLNTKAMKRSMPKSLQKAGKEKERRAWSALENKRIKGIKKQISDLKKQGRDIRDNASSPKENLKKAVQKSKISPELKIAEAEARMPHPPDVIPAKGPWQPLPEGLPEETWTEYFDAHPDNGGKAKDPARQELHNTIKSLYLDGVESAPEGTQPVVIMMMGGPASGKSSMVRAMGIDESQFVVADADAIKERIPEYRVAVRNRGQKAAAMAHEESSYLVKQIRQEAIASRKNLVIDGTGVKAKSYMDVIPELRRQGYKIKLLMADASVNVALPRAIERAEKTGRYVPDHFIIDAYPKIPGSFKQVSPLVDEFHVMDTGNAKLGEKPRTLYSKVDGQENRADEKWIQENLK